MKNNLTEEIIKIEKFNYNLDELSRLFNFVDQEEINFYLNFSKDYQEIQNKFADLQLSENDVKKYILIYLFLRNLANNQNNSLSTETKISTLNLIKNLDNNYQDKILIIYLLSGIYFLKFNIIHPIINLKKILLKYYHDIGGFEVNTWGLKIKIDLFKELINRKDIKKILSSNKKEIKWQDFYMLSYF